MSAANGGEEGTKDYMKVDDREVLKETTLVVRPGRFENIKNIVVEKWNVFKFWGCCEYIGGDWSIIKRNAAETFLKDTGFCSKNVIQLLNVFLPILKDAFWEDLADGSPQIKYLVNSSVWS